MKSAPLLQIPRKHPRVLPPTSAEGTAMLRFGCAENPPQFESTQNTIPHQLRICILKKIKHVKTLAFILRDKSTFCEPAGMLWDFSPHGGFQRNQDFAFDPFRPHFEVLLEARAN